MNTYSMTPEEVMRFGIDVQDVEDIWEKFEEFKYGSRITPEEMEFEDEMMVRAFRAEAIAEEEREYDMEYWVVEAQRMEELENLRSDIELDPVYQR